MSDPNEPRPSKMEVSRASFGKSWLVHKLRFLKRHIVTVATVGAVLSGLVGYWTTYRAVHEVVAPFAVAKPVEAGPQAMSVVVKPLVAPLGDAEAVKFADALTGDLVSRIGRAYEAAGRLQVLAFRSGSATNDTSPRKLARGLDACYVLQGNVLRSGDTRLVKFELIDASTGTQVWSDRITLQDSEVSAQSSVALRSIAHHVWAAVVSAEMQRVLVKPVPSLNARELVLRALASVQIDGSLAGVSEARKQVEMALHLDPNCVPALIARSCVGEAELMLNSRADESRINREMDEDSARAVALDPTNSSAWSSRAIALFDLDRWNAALQSIAAAIELDPENPELLNHRAGMLNFTGQPADALPLIERALAMDTSAANVGYASRQSCVAHLLLGQAAQAVAMCEKSAELGRASLATTPWLVAAYANNGEAGKAAAAKADVFRIAPHFTVAQAGAKPAPGNPEFRKLMEKYYFDGLRKAGIPEE